MNVVFHFPKKEICSKSLTVVKTLETYSLFLFSCILLHAIGTDNFRNKVQLYLK
jgi:hypothetical protein